MEKIFTFMASTLNETMTAAAMMNDTDKASITGKQVKEMATQLYAFKKDIIKCHEICTELDVPDFGGGLVGLKKRLEFLKEKYKGKIKKDG